MNIKIKFNSFIPKLLKARGVTIYPFIFFKYDRNHFFYVYLKYRELFIHEWAHIEQVRKMGWFKFYFTYLLKLIKYGYKNHPYEIEARKVNYLPKEGEDILAKEYKITKEKFNKFK